MHARVLVCFEDEDKGGEVEVGSEQTDTQVPHAVRCCVCYKDMLCVGVALAARAMCVDHTHEIEDSRSAGMVWAVGCVHAVAGRTLCVGHCVCVGSGGSMCPRAVVLPVGQWLQWAARVLVAGRYLLAARVMVAGRDSA